MSNPDTDQRRDAMLLHALRTPPQPRKKREREAKPSRTPDAAKTQPPSA
jgi:hypothetical protein